jgi:hypothetical protein
VQVSELTKLVELADNQTIKNPNSKYTIITVGAFNYKPVVHNWVHHMNKLNISNYVVLCVDQLIYRELDPAHAILMAPTFHLNLTHVRMKKRKGKDSSLAERFRQNSQRMVEKRGEQPFSQHVQEKQRIKEEVAAKIHALILEKRRQKESVAFAQEDKFPIERTDSETESNENSVEPLLREEFLRQRDTERHNRPIYNQAITDILRERYRDGLEPVSKNRTKKKKPVAKKFVKKGEMNRDVPNRRLLINTTKSTTPNATNMTDKNDIVRTGEEESSLANNQRSSLANWGNSSVPAHYVPVTKTAVRMFEHRIKEIGLDKAFSVLMVIKHSSIYALLSAGHSVVWSDVDCIWVQRCAYDYMDAFARPVFHSYYKNHLLDKGIRGTGHALNFNNYSEQALRDRVNMVQKMSNPPYYQRDEGFVDFISQQGLFPTEMSELIGTAICTGFFVVNPTAGSLTVVRAVRNSIIKLLASGKPGKGDQKTLNFVLMDLAKMYSRHKNHVLSTSLASSIINDTLTDRFVYGPSVNTGRPKEEILKLQLRIRSAADAIAAARMGALDSGSGYAPFTVGFLPYDLFPRGDARVSDPNMNTNSQLEHSYNWPSSPKNVAVSALTKVPDETKADKTKTALKVVQHNADEWSSLSSSACIWHMYSQKTGESKVESMQRDGVLLDMQVEDDDQAAMENLIEAESTVTTDGGDVLDAFQG